MSIYSVETTAFKPNFLDSAVGLVCKSRAIPASMGVVDGTRKTVAAGTIYPADDDTAEGILFTSVDVTGGDALGSVMVAGRVLKDRITVSSAAEAALKASGITFVTVE